MSCKNCEILFNPDCETEDCKDQRRRNRTALFDYMQCLEIEALEGWKSGT